MKDRSESREGAQCMREFILDGIANGHLSIGKKLPTEREFVKRFGVARSAARKALAALEAEGRITRCVGRGTFIAHPQFESAASPKNAESDNDISPAELMEARLRFEPELAELIVTNATSADFERMELYLAKAERAASLQDFEIWDEALHQALASATHNRFVMRMFEIITTVRQTAEWGRLKDRIVTHERRIRYQDEHRAIVTALKERDSARAKDCIITHLRHARRNLFGY